MGKHAYLILAHNNWLILEHLLRSLDDPRNDIYIHIDKKVKNFDFYKFSHITEHASVEFTEKRINGKWSGESLVRAEMELFEMASRTPHDYYHLISGVDFPIKTQDEIHLLLQNGNIEYINVLNTVSENDYERLSLYHLHIFSGRGILSSFGMLSRLCHRAFIYTQKILKIDRLKKYGMEFRRGAQWCSLTHGAVRYLVEHKSFIRKLCAFTHCPDECYKQYLLYNSPYRDRFYGIAEGKTRSLHIADWKRGNGSSPYTFREADFPMLTASDGFFARKFDEKVDMRIVELLEHYLQEKRTSSEASKENTENA